MILGKYIFGIPQRTKYQWTVVDRPGGYFDALASKGYDEGLEEWIFRGEKSVWEVGGYIRAKCAVEITLDHCMNFVYGINVVYGMLQGPTDGGGETSTPAAKETENEQDNRKWTRDRIRAKSFGPQDEVRLRKGTLKPVTATGER